MVVQLSNPEVFFWSVIGYGHDPGEQVFLTMAKERRSNLEMNMPQSGNGCQAAATVSLSLGVSGKAARERTRMGSFDSF